MSRCCTGTVVVLLTCALIAACSGTATEPELAVQEFYSKLNHGNYSGAKALYDAEARKLLNDPDLASDTGFAEWAKLETRRGTVDSVKVLSQTGDDSRVTVECEVIYADGTTKARTVSLTLEDGKWRLGLLG